MKEKQDDVSLNEAEEKLIKRLLKGKLPLEEDSKILDISKRSILPRINKLRKLGYDIVIIGDKVALIRTPEKGKRIVLPEIKDSVFRFMVVSDTLIGSTRSQMTLLCTAYEIGRKLGVRYVLHAGNFVIGRTSVISQDVFLDDFDALVNYGVEFYPTGLKTYVIGGPSDLTWKKKGRNIVRVICEQREDLRYMGDLEQVLEICPGMLAALIHVRYDTTVYTKSYSLQGIGEQYEQAIRYMLREGEDPVIVFLGGCGTHLYIPRINGRHLVALPSLCGRLTTQRTRKKRSGDWSLGFVIVEVNKETKEVKFDFRDLTAYRIKDDHLEPPEILASLNKEEKRILETLQEGPAGLGRLSGRIDKPKHHVEEVIESLIKKGYNIGYDRARKRFYLERDIWKRKFHPLPSTVFKGSKAKFAVSSDPHIGSRESQAKKLLPVVYETARREEVDVIAFCGDIFDGAGAYPGQQNELVCFTADAQRKLGEKNWPKETKIPTVLIRGSSHEKTFLDKCGHDIVGTFVELMRLKGNKMIYLKGISGVSRIRKIWYQLLHPKGGIPYGLSYRVQRIIEALVSAINKYGDKRIQTIFVGHLHQSMFMIYKGIAGFLVPCLQKQTEYLKGKGLIPMLGMWIVTIETDKKGNIIRIVPKHIKLADPW